MEIWQTLVLVSSVISSLAYIISIKIRESEKTKRIKEFKEMNNSKIEAIGNYEKKSKNKYSFPPWKKSDES